MKPILSEFIFRWKSERDGESARQKTRVVAQRSYELDADAISRRQCHTDSVRLVVVKAFSYCISMLNSSRAHVQTRLKPSLLH